DLSPAAPQTKDLLTATATTADADGDAVKLSYVWLKNGIEIRGQNGSTLDLSQPENGNKGDKITVAVTPRADTATAATVVAEVQVANSAPRIATLTLSPASPQTMDLLTARTTTDDPDGDAVALSYVWKNDGAKIPGQAGDTLDLRQLGNGDKGNVITV